MAGEPLGVVLRRAAWRAADAESERATREDGDAAFLAVLAEAGYVVVSRATAKHLQGAIRKPREFNQCPGCADALAELDRALGPEP